ncbi:MAG: DUF445 domain-containing protein [Xanthomonadales bacterium]|nr:DUF445 domain-containing protein [Xanthomonadales bacterium]
MKRLPLILLLVMAVLYTLSWDQQGAWLWLHAFSEAAMVGALADWFAVTALFRHPMGLPIPHTAIIARRKNEIGESMARFVAENFLQAEVLEKRLQSHNLAGIVISWLKQTDNRRQLIGNTLSLWSWLMAAVGEQRVRAFVTRIAQRQSSNFDVAKIAGQALEVMTSKGRHQEVFTQALRFAIVALSENEERIRYRVQHESPWWMPGFVDDKIVGQLLQRIETVLFEMALDPEHELRQRFDQQLEKLTKDLQTLPEYKLLGERIKKDFMQNDSIQEYLLRLWNDLAARLKLAESDPDSKIHLHMDNLLQGLVVELEADPGMRELLDQWISAAITHIVSENADSISGLISDTVRSWDADTTSRRVELAIGRDLQFIRINGTLVGGLVGVLLLGLNLLVEKFI